MANIHSLQDRMLSHQHAGPSNALLRDVRPRAFSRSRRVPVMASATQSASRSIPKLPEIERKEQGPGRVFLSSTRAAAGQLWGVLKFFQAEEAAAVSPETDASVLGDTAKRAQQV